MTFKIVIRRTLNYATAHLVDTSRHELSDQKYVAMHSTRRDYPDDPLPEPTGWLDTNSQRFQAAQLREFAETLAEYAQAVESLALREHLEHEWTTPALPALTELEVGDLICLQQENHVQRVERVTATQAVTTSGLRLRRLYGNRYHGDMVRDSTPGDRPHPFRAYRRPGTRGDTQPSTGQYNPIP
jgi:hypothetical protein